MTTGEGIFYGLVFIGLILLYAVTRDRWKWKKIGKWGALLLLVPIVGIGAWVGVTSYVDSRAKFQAEFWGVSPGIAKDELIFRKGKPDQEQEEYFVYGKGEDNVYYAVSFRNEKVRAIRAVVPSDKPYALPAMQGISNYSSLDDIERKFGAADKVSETKDKTRRLLSFLKYGVFFELEKGTVVSLGAFDPKEGQLIFKDD